MNERIDPPLAVAPRRAFLRRRPRRRRGFWVDFNPTPSSKRPKSSRRETMSTSTPTSAKPGTVHNRSRPMNC